MGQIALVNTCKLTLQRLSLCIKASGAIYLSNVGLWVAYYVPCWVHRHDEVSGQSVERYKVEMSTAPSTPGELSRDSAQDTADTDRGT